MVGRKASGPTRCTVEFHPVYDPVRSPVAMKQTARLIGTALWRKFLQEHGDQFEAEALETPARLIGTA